MVVRNVLQLKSEKQAMACAEAHLILLTNGAPGKVLGNPVAGCRLHEIDVRLFVQSREEGHIVTLSAFTKKGEQITTFTSNIFHTSPEDVVETLPRGLELIAKSLTSFGMEVPIDWASPLLIGGTDEEFVANLRKAVGSA
jgi:hypothetical protein